MAMALDLSKLQKKKQKGSDIECQCPACFESGQDSKGNHLIVYADGAYGCVVNKGDKFHSKRIAELVGIQTDYKNGSESVIRYRNKINNCREQLGEEVATYPYLDATGVEVYRVVRYKNPKSFRPFHLDKGQWVLGLNGCDRVPYRLPELLKSDRVIIVEGEKDADNLVALGYVATTRQGGGSTWDEELTPYFRGKEIIFFPDNDKIGEEFALKVEKAVRGVARSWRICKIPNPHKDISDALEGLSDAEARSLIEILLIDPILVDLEKRKFNVHKPPLRTEPVLYIQCVGIAKPGDLVAIQAQVKSGKSSLLAAMIGCIFNPSNTRDYLGCSGSNPNNWPILHIDTEQSPEDHYDMMMRTLRRADLQEAPPWFHSYCLTDFSGDKRRKILNSESRRLKQLYGGMCLILLDGAADCVTNVNDIAESNGFVDEIFGIAIECSCPVISIIHENHGSESGKTRGHLGSQMERKAASNLRMTKDSSTGIIQVFGEKLRRGYIAKDTGPHFIWDDDEGMHVTCAAPINKQAQERNEAFDALVSELFMSKSTLNYALLRSEIMKIRNIQAAGAEKIITKLQYKHIKKTAFGYEKTVDFTLQPSIPS